MARATGPRKVHRYTAEFKLKAVKLSELDARLAALGITQSMKRPREIGDSAFIESFFHTLKADVIHGHVFDNDHALFMAISHYTHRFKPHANAFLTGLPLAH